jgi:hypothetical protein
LAEDVNQFTDRQFAPGAQREDAQARRLGGRPQGPHHGVRTHSGNPVDHGFLHLEMYIKISLYVFEGRRPGFLHIERRGGVLVAKIQQSSHFDHAF